jgi:hypothetical protein
MPHKRRNDDLLESLALHVAIGGKVVHWADAHRVGKRTAYEWSVLPEFKALVRQHRAVIVDRILGKHFRLADKAVRNIAKLMDGAQNEAVRYQANHNILADLTTLSTFADFEKRLTALEKTQNGSPNGNDPQTPTD